MMCAAFSSAPVLALTATASYKDISIIKESLNLKKKTLEVIASPNRANLFYEKVFCENFGTNCCQTEGKKSRPSTNFFILYLKWCGFVFKFLEMQLDRDQYYPTTSENRPLAQYHARQTSSLNRITLTLF